MCGGFSAENPPLPPIFGRNSFAVFSTPHALIWAYTLQHILIGVYTLQHVLLGVYTLQHTTYTLQHELGYEPIGSNIWLDIELYHPTTLSNKSAPSEHDFGVCSGSYKSGHERLAQPGIADSESARETLLGPYQRSGLVDYSLYINMNILEVPGWLVWGRCSSVALSTWEKWGAGTIGFGSSSSIQ